MKRAILFVVLITFSFSLFSSSISYDYEPYEEDEFPIWLSEIRRAESIFFGSLVITFPITMAGFTIAESLGANTGDDDFKSFLQQLGIASAASLLIAGIDWLIGYFSD